MGTRENAMGSTSISYESIMTRNPAFIPQDTHQVELISQYHFSGIPLVQLNVVYALNGVNTLQGSIASFATNIYRDQQFSLQYGRKLNKKLRIGIGTLFHLEQVPNHSSYYSTLLRVGTNYQITKVLNISFFTQNYLQTSVIEQNNVESTKSNEMIIGLNYHKDRFQFVGEYQIKLGEGTWFRLGGEYFVNRYFHVQVGWHSQNGLGFGTRVLVQNYSIGIASSYQEYLGWSPHFSLAYGF
ncbi:MAG: hypothetical protein GY827_06690 [Cytophagales bacterium]|nr:hypothetical protein [Cytophagales bacterium]